MTKDPALAAGPGNAKSADAGLLMTVADRWVQEDARRLAWTNPTDSASVFFGRGQAWDASGLNEEWWRVAGRVALA